MKTRHFFLTLVALIAFAGNAMADTTKLLEADGWTKITTVPTSTDINNNYYVFVDTSRDLMLGTGKGANQNTKWYSLGVYYYTSVEPTSAQMNNMVWTLESYSDGFAMRNLEYSALAFQTEWNAAWKWDTNDVPGTNDWTKLYLAYADGSWTIQNGYYPNSGYLGPWNDGNFTNGAECAANKSGNNVGKFQIYTISRAQYKQNLLDNASSTNPVDLTPWYVTNATFDLGNRDGWTQEGSGGNNNTSYGGGCEIWHRSGFKIYQTATVPNGKYKVSLQIAGTSGVGQVYGTSGATTKTVTNTAAAGNNFQNTILSMIQDRNFGKVTTDEIEVTNGSITLGMQCATTDQWLNFDNFKLYCTGVDLSAYQAQLAALVQECNDFISSNVVPNACETIVSNAVTQYNQTYSTAKEYSNAIVALTSVLNTYRNNTDLTTAYANFFSYKNQIETLSAGQESSIELTTFNNALSTATTNVEAATTAAAVTAEIANVRSAGMTYISTAEGQFDITFLASQTYTDWKNYYGNPAGLLSDTFLTNRPNTIPSFPEFWIAQADLTGKQVYQTVEGLPEGYYQVGMYAGALSTSQRDGFQTEASDGDSDRTFAFAGDEADATSIMRTGMPIKFATVVDFSELTILDVNVHLTGSGNTNNLTFGITKDSNGSNWHFAQIASIIYSNQPDLTQLKATRDALVAEAQGILSRDGDYLTTEQKTALQAAITAGNNADNFDSLNTVTLTTLPNAINTAKQQIAQAQAAIPVMHQALERFEQYYNLVDGTDYQRVTMSAKAWTDLLDKVNAATLALDDISQAANYATIAADLNAQMDATDVSIRLFKSYKAMVEGCQDLGIDAGTTYATSTYMDTDAKEQEAIAALNAAFVTYRESQSTDIDMAGFLGDNLDFSEAEGSQLGSIGEIYDMVGWEETYNNVTVATDYLRNQSTSWPGQLYIRSNWGNAATYLTAAKMKMLPEGEYQLTVKWNSNLANMTNLSKFALGTDNTTIGETTSEYKDLIYNFTVSDVATDFDLIFGFEKTGTGNTPAQILVDEVSLICVAGTPFQRAYDAAEDVADNTAAKAAAKSTTEEYAQYDGNESGLLENGERGDAYWQAVNVLRNAKTIADADGDATSLVVNADLTNTTVTDRAPAGWTTYYEGNDGGDIWVRTQDGAQVFNIWTNGITLIDLTQAIANLPKGAYRLSIDMGTDGFREDGSARVFNFVNPDYMKIGASELVTTQNNAQNRAFDTYTSAAEVGDAHKLTIGVRSDGNYFQMKNIKLEYIGDNTTAAAETDASFVRQDFYWQDQNSDIVEFFFDGEDYSNAQNVKVYPTGVNRIIHGVAGEFAESVPNADNGGTCANLVITDGSPLTNTRAFNATAATYSRDMSRTWGTLILPYPLTSDENVQYYTFKQISTDAEGTDFMGFAPAESVAANTPVVFKKLGSEATSVTLAGSGSVTTTIAEQGTASVDNADWSMTGVYAETTLTNDQIDGTVYYIAQDQFWKANTEVGLTIPAFRAYFHGPAGEGAAKFRIKIIDDEATRIVDLQQGIELGGDIYTLGGQLVRKNATSLEGLQRGTYIIGGKKVFIK